MVKLNQAASLLMDFWMLSSSTKKGPKIFWEQMAALHLLPSKTVFRTLVRFLGKDFLHRKLLILCRVIIRQVTVWIFVFVNIISLSAHWNVKKATATQIQMICLNPRYQNMNQLGDAMLCCSAGFSAQWCPS